MVQVDSKEPSWLCLLLSTSPFQVQIAAKLTTYNASFNTPVSSTGAPLPLLMEDFLNLDSFDSAQQLPQQQQPQQSVLVAGQDDTNGMSFTELFQQ